MSEPGSADEGEHEEAPGAEAKPEEAPKPQEPEAEIAKLEAKPEPEEAKPEEPAPEPPKPEELKAEAPKPDEPKAEEPARVEEPPPPPVPPVVLSVTPDHGPLAGGTQVVIIGEGFAEGCQVLVGGVVAEVKYERASRLQAVIPAGAKKGMAELRVVNPDELSALYEDDYRYDPPPILAGVEPAALSTAGGGVLTILGSELVQGSAVRIDGELVPCSWANAGRLEAVTKAHAAGEVDVAVESPDGQRAVRARGVRFADPPRVQAVEPASGVTLGGTEVAIRGSAFTPGATALLAGAPLGETRFVGETELRIVTPPHPVGAVDVAVVNPTGLAHRLPLAFSFVKAPPRVTSVSPALGPNAGGTEIVIAGEAFDEQVMVYVCGIAAGVTARSATEIRATTPPVARDGIVDVRVVNGDDQAHVAEKAFRYFAPLPPPELRQVGPSRGSQVGGLPVALLGEGFAEGITARFGGVAAAVRFLTSKEIAVTTPAFTGHGEVDVEVTNPDGASSVLAGAFTYEPKPAPEITGITPTNGPATGGTRVKIEGKNFTPQAAVYVGREPPKDMVVKSAAEIHVVVAPRKTPGVVDVEVAVPGAPKAVMKNGFRYDAVPAPVITSVAPSAGAVGGGTEMTVSGKNFTKETAVLVGGQAPRTVKLVDASTLEFKTPPGEAGKMVDVTVRNPDGKEAVQKRAFLYDPRYRG
jgi:hypothetical protein